jgi:glycosyltransferase involved in cell wall biosynthesis
MSGVFIMEYKQVTYKSIDSPIPQKYAKTILCVALVNPKRFDIFLEVASMLPNYAFIWIGNNEPIKDISENVFCLGNIPEAGKYNQLVDLFMLPSDYEGLPIVIIEAMGYGKPVVASHVGGISEIVINDENGYTVENDPNIFADKIVYILENEVVYGKFSKNSLHRFNTDLTIERMMKEYINIYRSPLNGIQRYERKILCIARISKQKRFETFLEVASLLPCYAFLWIGNQKNIHNTLSNVFCLGNVLNAERYDQLVDLFMLPTNYEGFPIVIIEAMRFGKPIVASNVGGISEVVINDENGYTVENTATIFAEKIRYILENASVYKKFSENAYKRFREHLTVEKMIQGYMKIYLS